MSRASVSSNRPSTAETRPGTAQVELEDDEPFPGGYVAKALFEKRSEYLTWRACKIKVGTWNVATSEDTEKDISKWLVDEHKPKVEVKAKKATSKIGKWFKNSVARRNGNKKDKSNGDDDDHIDVEDDDDIGIYVIALQEVIDVSATENFLKSSDSKVKKMWEEHITAALPTHTCILSQQLIGLLLFVYVLPDLSSQITTKSSTSVGTGLMGYMGNKGACLARIVLGGLPAASIIPPVLPEDSKDEDPIKDERGLVIVFVDSHLAAFANAVDRRNWDFAEIQRRAFFHPKVLDPVVGGDTDQEDLSNPAGIQIYDADIIFWTGDLNYRLDLPNDDIRKAFHPFLPAEEDGRHPTLTLQGPLDTAEEERSKSSEQSRSLQQTITQVLKSDQLYEQQRLGKAFTYYHEGPINFLPTYKYDNKTIATFDSSEKVRGPSYCDRILWKVKSVALEEEERKRNRDVSDIRDKRRESFVDDGITEVLFSVGKENDEDDDEDFQNAVEDTGKPEFDTRSSLDEIYSPVTLLSYTSHQLITSSDHKPVSAEFRLEYLAVSQSAKARIHAEIVKELDRNENELRPMVTVVVDNDKSNTGIADFGDIRWGEKKIVSVTIANTGRGLSTCEFVKRPITETLETEDEDSGFAKLDLQDHALAFGDESDAPQAAGSEEEVSREWLTAQFNSTLATDPITLEPGDAESITLEISLPPRHSSDALALLRQLNSQKVPLLDVLVLRIAHGRDIFIPVKGSFITTYLGYSLVDLLRIPENAGGLRGNYQTLSKNNLQWSAPRELFRMTEYLMASIRTIVQSEGGQGVRWTMLPGWPFMTDTWGLLDDPHQERSKTARTTLKLWVRDGLDCDREWQWQEMENMGYTLEECVEVMAESLLEWLACLESGLVPATFYRDVLAAAGSRVTAEKILDALTSPVSNVHANVFIYLSGFITEMIAILSPPIDSIVTANANQMPSMPQSPTKPSASSKLTTAELIKNNLLRDFSSVMIRRPKGVADRKGDMERRMRFLRWFCE